MTGGNYYLVCAEKCSMEDKGERDGEVEVLDEEPEERREGNDTNNDEEEENSGAESGGEDGGAKEEGNETEKIMKSKKIPALNNSGSAEENGGDMEVSIGGSTMSDKIVVHIFLKTFRIMTF